MPIGLGSGLWAAVLPVDATNIQNNPSFEFGNAGVVAIQSATLGTTSQFQRFGAQSLKVTPNANGTSGAILGTWVSGIGTTYSVSAWAFVEAGVPMRIAIGDGNGGNLTNGSVTFTGGGTWQWYNTGIIEVSNTNRALVIQKTSGNSQLPFYVDGVMINPWTDSQDRVISYFDGDTGGGTWLGAQHASQSTRSGQYRSGGSIIALADIGLQVDQMLGVGVSPIENSAQSYAVTDGAQFQRTRAAQRKFTLTAKPIVGTSLADFHATRRTIWDAFKPDLVTPQQPVRLMYYGAQGTQYIDAYYDKGLELGNMDGPMAENAAVSFVSYDPYWYAPTQQGTTLVNYVSMGSTNYLLERSPQGVWGTLGVAGTTVTAVSGNVIHAMALNPNGTLFFGGFFGSVGGTQSQNIGFWSKPSRVFGTLTGGTLTGSPLRTMTLAPSGTLYIGGDMTNIAGTSTQYLAQWNGAYGSLVGGTLESGVIVTVRSMHYSPAGTLFVGGQFDKAGGTTARFAVQWVNNAFGTLIGQASNGTLDSDVTTLLTGLDGRLIMGGKFTKAGGTTTSRLAQWNGAFGSIAGAPDGDPAALAVEPNGRVVLGGAFSTISGGSAFGIADWNAVQWSPFGSGLWLGSTPSIPDVRSLAVNRTSGVIYAGGVFARAGGLVMPDSLAQWNGASWLPLDIDIQGQGTILAMQIASDSTLYIGGNFSGTAVRASVGTIVNTGRSSVYPVLRMRNASAGTARLYQVLNATTGDGIWFNTYLLPGEIATLTLQPGQRSFQSSFRGNMFSVITPGSNLATFNLSPGTNYVSFFSDNTSLETAFFWQPRGLAIDSGTVG